MKVFLGGPNTHDLSSPPWPSCPSATGLLAYFVDGLSSRAHLWTHEPKLISFRVFSLQVYAQNTRARVCMCMLAHLGLQSDGAVEGRGAGSVSDLLPEAHRLRVVRRQQHNVQNTCRARHRCYNTNSSFVRFLLLTFARTRLHLQQENCEPPCFRLPSLCFVLSLCSEDGFRRHGTLVIGLSDPPDEVLS